MALIKKMKPERGKKNPGTKGSETKGSNLVIYTLRELKMGISPIFRSRLARPQAPVGLEIDVNKLDLSPFPAAIQNSKSDPRRIA